MGGFRAIEPMLQYISFGIQIVHPIYFVREGTCVHLWARGCMDLAVAADGRRWAGWGVC